MPDSDGHSCRKGSKTGLNDLPFKLPLLLLVGYRALGPFSGARVCLASLPSHGEAAPVAHTSVAADFGQTLDIKCDLAAQIALDDITFVDTLAERGFLRLRDILHSCIGVDACRFKDLFCACTADPEYVGESYFDSFVSGQINAGNTCHL